MEEHTEMRPAAPTGSGAAEIASATRRVRYSRVVHAAPGEALDAIIRTATALGYPRHGEDPPGGGVRFEAMGGIVIASATAAEAGRSTIIVEFTGLRWRAVGSSAVVILPGVLLGAAVKAAEAYFAYGFLDNVARMLQGRPLGRDSARLPILSSLRRGLDIEED